MKMWPGNPHSNANRSSSVSSTSTTASFAHPARNTIDNSVDVRALWHCMVDLQRRYGCYRSARMSAAVEDETSFSEPPSESCLKLLNDTLFPSDLPTEAWRELARYVAVPPSCLAAGSWRSHESEDEDDEGGWRGSLRRLRDRLA